MAGFLSVTAVLFAGALARAHGQFPLPTGVLTDGDGGRPLVVATFGVLVPDGPPPGYRWICEEMAGGNVVNAVNWARTSTGTLLGAGRNGAVRWEPNLCAVTEPAGVHGERVRGVVTHPTRPWVLLAMAAGDVRLSVDDGRTFQAFATRAGAVPQSLLFSRAEDAPRAWIAWDVLVDGHVEVQGPLDDGGSAATLGADSGAPFWDLVAEDPARPGTLYVRENGDWVDRVLRFNPRDGITTIVRQENDDLFTAVTRDGQRVATGGAGSVLRVSTNAGESFADRPTLAQVRSLAWSPQGSLYAAADNWHDGFSAGVSHDEGGTWTGMGEFFDIRGVLVCADAGPGCAPGADACAVGQGNDVQAACEGFYPSLAERFGRPLDGGADDAGTTEPPRPPPPPRRPGCINCSQGDGTGLVVVVAVWLRRRITAR